VHRQNTFVLELKVELKVNAILTLILYDHGAIQIYLLTYLKKSGKTVMTRRAM